MCWLHSWRCFRAQTSALQQAIPFFLGAANRDATTVPPMTIRRNTSTLIGTFTGVRRFTSSIVSADARRGEDIARTCENEWSHGTAAKVLSAVRLTHSRWLSYPTVYLRFDGSPDRSCYFMDPAVQAICPRNVSLALLWILVRRATTYRAELWTV